MKKLILPLFIIASLFATAQTDVDAFHFSRSSLAGTARFVGMGGAFGAIGGDLSVMSYNPAGLGIYRSAEFSISPSIYTGNTNADYLDGNTIDGKTVFNFGNAGIVLTSKPMKKEGWVSWNLGVAYNRLLDFNNVHSLEGYNNSSSLLDFFTQNAQGTSIDNLDGFKELLAYNAYLLDTVGNIYSYENAAPGGNVLQRRSSETRGSVGETSFALSGNYNNKLYLGASLGIVNLRYTEETSFEEIDSKNQHDSLDQYQYNTYLNSEGSGVNLKIGFIYRPTDYFRFGGAIHTPTVFNLTDNYNSSIGFRYDAGFKDKIESDNGMYDYQFTSPFRALGSVAFIFGKAGLFSVDYEYKDPSASRFRASDYNFISENRDIRNKYTATHSVRAGTEWKLDNFSIRAGYGYTTSPMDTRYKVSGYDFSGQQISGGIGFREKNFFVDLAYLYAFSNEYFQPYLLENKTVDGSYEHVTGYNFTATFGVKF